VLKVVIIIIVVALGSCNRALVARCWQCGSRDISGLHLALVQPVRVQWAHLGGLLSLERPSLHEGELAGRWIVKRPTESFWS